MSRLLRRFAGIPLLFVALGLMGSHPAAAQGYPRFTGKRIYLSGVPDTGYSRVQRTIAEVERTAPETYYLVVTRSTGSGSWATRDYTDALYQRWRSDARSRGLRLDPDRHVLIVLGVENRQLSVHAGVRLQNDLRFTGSTIDREVVQPIFIPYAKAGDFPEGVAALVPGIHRWLRRAEAAQAAQRRRREAEQRRQKAELLAGIRTERTKLTALQARIVKEGREGLATGNLEKQREGAVALLQQAENLAGHPASGLEKLRAAQVARSRVEQRLTGLRQAREAARQGSERARTALAHAESELERVRATGLPPGDPERRLGEGREALARAEALLTSDYDGALTQARAAEGHAAWVTEAVRYDQLLKAAARRRHHFLTRTLPTAAGLVLLVALLITAIVLRVRHLRLKREVQEHLAALLKALVQQMERMEALTERHKRLLGTDPDFIVPMAGRTLALYEETEATHQRAWSLWGDVVASREQIEKLIGEEHPLARRGLQTAKDRLQELARDGELSTLLDTVKDHLDCLNQAHEVARDAAAELQARRDTAEALLQKVAAEALPVEPYQTARQAAEAGAVEATGLLDADPLAATEVTNQTAAGAAELIGWLERVLAAATERRDLLERADRLQALAADRRAEGYLLTEAGGNPDPPLAEARDLLERTWEHLQTAADGPARECLTAAAEQLASGEAAVEAQVVGRAFCAQDLPTRRAETQRLTEHLQRAAAARADLVREFAASCWPAVANHCLEAEVALAGFSQTCTRAESLADLRTQRYLSARALLEEVARGQAQTEAALSAVEQTLATLRAIRGRVQTDLPRVREAAAGVEAFFQAHPASPRPHAHQQRAAGRTALQTAEAAADLQPPDWVTAAKEMQLAEGLLTASLNDARQDVEAHRRVVERLAAAERACAGAAEFLHRETADRPAAALRLGEGVRLLEQARQEVQTSGADWPALEVLLGQAIEYADGALQMAKEDVRLQSQAQSEIFAAERATNAVDRYFGHGIRGDVSSARSALGSASSALASQRYEEAIRLAEEAIAYARAAERAARAQVSRIEDEIRRRREAEERARREAEEAAERARRAAASSSSSSWSSGSSSSSFSSGSSSSSYDSGTSQSSW